MGVDTWIAKVFITIPTAWRHQLFIVAWRTSWQFSGGSTLEETRGLITAWWRGWFRTNNWTPTSWAEKYLRTINWVSYECFFLALIAFKTKFCQLHWTSCLMSTTNTYHLSEILASRVQQLLQLWEHLWRHFSKVLFYLGLVAKRGFRPTFANHCWKQRWQAVSPQLSQ